MISVPNMTQPPVVASRKQLLLGAAIAFVLAAFVLVAFVLPAEFGIDPTGAGRLLGLTEMSGEPGEIAAQVMNEHDRKFRSARVLINVKPLEELEYKATLAAGEPLLYSWTVAGSSVYFEFHGEPTEGEWPKDYYRSYQIKEKSTGEHGSFIAPFTGRHGWYWKNLTAEPATITLEAAGYYTKLERQE
jgi:hypothetical protein